MTSNQRLASDSLDTLDAGISVLESFPGPAQSLALGEISARLDLSKSRVFRILTTLKRRGFVEQASRGGPYRLGYKLERLGSAVATVRSLPRVAVPVMRDLSQTLRGTIVLRVPDGDEQLTVECVHSPEVLRTSYPVGARLSLTYGSTGKILMAFRPPQAAEEILRRVPLTHSGPRAIIEPAAYLRELDGVRAAGYALSLEEAVAGVRGVAAPVFDGDGTAIAAIAVSFPASALPKKRLPTVARALAEASRAIGSQFGFTAVDPERRRGRAASPRLPGDPLDPTPIRS
jgi:DNA-binding IclR family transcriptional regulator